MPALSEYADIRKYPMESLKWVEAVSKRMRKSLETIISPLTCKIIVILYPIPPPIYTFKAVIG
jgi:hypothetical protein